MNTIDIHSFAKTITEVEKQISKEMVGQRDIVRHLLIAMIAGGNVLLEGVPGLGKTRLVRTMGHVMGLSFSRVQFTPDLMPADITGTNIIVKEEAGNRFQFQPGPVFHHIVLADEINRATPKTQSALLEAMQEHTVTTGGETRPLPQPFFVLATQNPLEQEGTYPLPEAQLDRFFFKLIVEFPTLSELHDIVNMTTGTKEVQAETALSGDELIEMRNIAKEVPIAQAVMDYALRLVLITHPGKETSPEITNHAIRYGASPRAAQALVSAARVRALMEGRFNVAFEDIKVLAPAVLRHRLALSFEGLSEGLTPDTVIAHLIAGLDKEVA